ncbi:uncharacterized protein Gasu_53760 [Galdieria sulphuraria]|uniref:Nucleolar complex-associated protein 3 N-terminal domain-containing protein n=1 Tax=Galdieria sulphuraria TaxID=130081 RepID=M2WT19_GALSU|nr:uncharacterized protein Gasu_53760 [Galdieria sulphuraria]EME27040.1 hypothetical protein Gasu_53760 [Galdieria sulphuraria]|eukprot:XP_005703560.1 hypothetical protein Gasu_53760 [Galdieria sulphuraria]
MTKKGYSKGLKLTPAKEKTVKKEIAILSEKILAQPQQNLKYLKQLFVYAFDWTPTQQEQVETVSNIATLSITSLVIIFRDIIPGYPILSQKERKEEGTTLSVETLRIRKFESRLLEYYVELVNQLLQRRKKDRKCVQLGKNGLGQWKSAVKQVILPAHTRALCVLLTDLVHFNEANRIAKALIKYTPRANEQERRWIRETLTELTSSLHRVSGYSLKTCLNICQYLCMAAAKWNIVTPSIFCSAFYCINYAALYSEYQQAARHREQQPTESDSALNDPLIDERSFQRDWREAQGRARDDERRIRFERVIESVEQFLICILQSSEDKQVGDILCLGELLELFVKVSIYLSDVSVRRLEFYLRKLSSHQIEDMEKSCLLLKALYQVHFLQSKNRGWKEDTGYLDSLLYQSCGRLLDCRSIHNTDTSQSLGSLFKLSLWWLNPARDRLLRRKTIWRRLLWLLLRTESPLLMNIITATFIHGIPVDWNQASIDSDEQWSGSLEMLIREALVKNPDVSYLDDAPPLYEYFILSQHFHPYIRNHFVSVVRGHILPLSDSIEEWLSAYTDEMTFIPPVAQTMKNSKSFKRKSLFLTSLPLLEEKEENVDWNCLVHQTKTMNNETKDE